MPERESSFVTCVKTCHRRRSRQIYHFHRCKEYAYLEYLSQLVYSLPFTVSEEEIAQRWMLEHP